MCSKRAVPIRDGMKQRHNRLLRPLMGHIYAWLQILAEFIPVASLVDRIAAKLYSSRK